MIPSIVNIPSRLSLNTRAVVRDGSTKHGPPLSSLIPCRCSKSCLLTKEMCLSGTREQSSLASKHLGQRLIGIVGVAVGEQVVDDHADNREEEDDKGPQELGQRRTVRF